MEQFRNEFKLISPEPSEKLKSDAQSVDLDGLKGNLIKSVLISAEKDNDSHLGAKQSAQISVRDHDHDPNVAVQVDASQDPAAAAHLNSQILSQIIDKPILTPDQLLNSQGNVQSQISKVEYAEGKFADGLVQDPDAKLVVPN